jgi:hypothetical protein
MQHTIKDYGLSGTRMVGRYAIYLMCFLILVGCSASRKGKTTSVLHFRTVGQIPVIEGTINGKRAFFIVDTGASCSILDESVSERFDFNFIVKTNSNVYGLGGQANINQAFDVVVKIGPLTINHRKFRTKRLDYLTSVINRNEGVKIAGLIGSDILNYYNVAINFRNGTLSF